MPVAELPPVLKDLIQEWFTLVDTDGSGMLSMEDLDHMFAVRSACLIYLLLVDGTSGTVCSAILAQPTCCHCCRQHAHESRCMRGDGAMSNFRVCTCVRDCLDCLQLCHVPCDHSSLRAMVAAMAPRFCVAHSTGSAAKRPLATRSNSARITWPEFAAYMTGEFAAGKNLLAGPFLTPPACAASASKMPHACRHAARDAQRRPDSGWRLH